MQGLREIQSKDTEERVFIDHLANRLVIRVRPTDAEREQIVAFNLFFDGHVLGYDSEYDRKTGYKFVWRTFDSKSHATGPASAGIDLNKIERILVGDEFRDIKDFVWKRAVYLGRFLKAPFLLRPLIEFFEPF